MLLAKVRPSPQERLLVHWQQEQATPVRTRLAVYVTLAENVLLLVNLLRLHERHQQQDLIERQLLLVVVAVEQCPLHFCHLQLQLPQPKHTSTALPVFVLVSVRAS